MTRNSAWQHARNPMLMVAGSLAAYAAVSSPVIAQQVLDPLVVQTPLDRPVATSTRSNPQRSAAPAQAPATPGAPAEAPVEAAIATPTAIEALSGSSGLSRGDIANAPGQNRIGGALSTVPGVFIQDTSRDPAQSVNIRGLQNFGRVNVLIDGMRQNFQRSGHSADGSFYLEPEMVKNVDITRGPTATVFGSGAIGGVVNFGLIDADDILRANETVGLRLSTRYSTNGRGPHGSAAGAVRVGGFDAIAQINGRELEDYKSGDGRTIVGSGEATESILLRSRYRFNGHQVSGTFIDYSARFLDTAGTSATAVTISPTSTRRSSDLENRQYNVGYAFARPDVPLVDFSAKIYRNETTLNQTVTGGTFEPLGARRQFSLVTEGIDVSNTSRFRWANTRLALGYGADGFRDEVTTSDNGGAAAKFTPGGQRTVYGAFVQSHLTFFNTVDLITALRYDHYALDGSGVSLEGERASPKVTLGYTPFKWITVFGTYAEGYRAPAVTETLQSGFHPPPATFQFLPNPALRPEVAETMEVGVNLRADRIFTAVDAFRAKVTVFRNDVADFISARSIPCPVPLNGCIPRQGAFQYDNFAKAEIEGVELEAYYDTRQWFVSATAQRLRGETIEKGVSSFAVTVPPDQVTLTAGVRLFDEKLTLGVRGRFIDEQTRTTASLVTPGYTLVDLFLNYQPHENLTINVNLDNITDEQYRVYRHVSPAAGFAARVGATVRLGTP